MSKSWKILLLLLVEHDVPSDRPRSFLAVAKFPPLQYPLSIGHNCPNNLPLHPSPIFLLGSSRLSAVPGFLAIILPLQKLTNFCVHGASYLSHLDHSATRRSSRPSELNVSKNIAPSFVSCFFHDSHEIHTNIVQIGRQLDKYFWKKQIKQMLVITSQTDEIEKRPAKKTKTK